MNGGREDDMAERRARADVAEVLGTWMDEVAPQRAPERLLEEAFARTMVARQAPVFPWHIRLPWRRTSVDRPIGRLAVAAVSMAVVVAIGGTLLWRSYSGISSQPSPTASPSPSASQSSLPPAVLVAPSALIAVEHPVAMATDGTWIWLFTEAGKVVRIDPATNRVAVTADLAKSTDQYQGLSGDATGLWVTDWDTSLVERFDPLTLRPVTTVAVGPNPKGVLVAAGAVWIANTRGGSVARIDPATNKVVATVSVGLIGPSGPNWLAAGFGSIWVGVPNNGQTVRINATTNAVEARIMSPPGAVPCGGLAAAPGAVWITSCVSGNLIARIDPTTNAAVATVDMGGFGGAIALIDGRPWVSPEDGDVIRIDPLRNVVDRVIDPGPGFVGGGEVVVAAGSLWVVDAGSNHVVRLPIASLGG